MTVVESTAREANAAARELAVGAARTLGELLGHSVAEVAEAERIVANADNSAVSVARRASSRRSIAGAGAGAGAGASLGARIRSRRSRWLSGGRLRSDGGSGRLRSDVGSGRLRSNRCLGNNRSTGSRGGASCRRCTWGKDASTIGGSSSSLSRAAELTSTSAQDGHGSAVGTRDSSTRHGVFTSGNAVTRVGVDKVLTRSDLALGGRKVGNEHVRQLAKDGRDIGRSSVALGAAAGDGERGAVHVELSVAELVEPGPGEGVLTCRQTLRDLDGNRGVAHVILVVGHIGIFRASLAAVNLAVKNLPLRILGRLGVCGNGELARTTAVRGTTLELNLQGATSRDRIHRCDSICTSRLLAREVCRFQRSLLGARVLPVEGHGRVQDHVR